MSEWCWLWSNVYIHASFNIYLLKLEHTVNVLFILKLAINHTQFFLKSPLPSWQYYSLLTNIFILVILYRTEGFHDGSFTIESKAPDK